MHVLVTQVKTRVTQAMGSQSCRQQQCALDLSGNVEEQADTTCPQCMCWSHRQRLESHRQWEARVDGPANALDLSGNVGTEVHLGCMISWECHPQNLKLVWYSLHPELLPPSRLDTWAEWTGIFFNLISIFPVNCNLKIDFRFQLSAFCYQVFLLL